MDSKFFFFLVLAWATGWEPVQGGYNCIERCSCMVVDGVYSADCTALNLTTVPIPKFYQVNILNLDFNRIRYVAKNAFLRYTSLEDVRLSANRIRSIEEEAFLGLGRSNLTRLDLSRNDLSSLPVSELRRISSNLEYLSLAYNRITAIPDTLSEMPKLRELDVSHNSMISAMPRAQLPASLAKLNIAFTSIAQFDKRSFDSTPNLRELRMSDNLASGSVRFVEGTFDGLTQLRHLDLSRCFCRKLPPNSFAKLGNLTTLLLKKSYLRAPPVFSVLETEAHSGDKGNGSGDNGGTTDATSMPAKPVDVPLDGNDQLLYRRRRAANDTRDPALDITPTPKPTPPQPVLRWLNPKLETLDLSQNRGIKLSSSGEQGRPIFPPALVNLDLASIKFATLRAGDLSNLHSLRNLYLCASGLKTIVPGALATLRSLKSLCLSSNPLALAPDVPPSVVEINMTDTDVTALTRSFLGNLTNVVMLDFSGGSLQNVEDRALEHLQRLRAINLSRNALQRIEENTLFIGNASGGSSQLEVLDLSDNAIKFLGDLAFQSHSGLVELLLNNNDLTEITERTLIGLGGLKTLDLSWNSLIEVASGAFRHLHAVKEIRLNNNELEEIFPEQFSSATALVRLNLADNRLLIVNKQSFPSLLSLMLLRNNLTDFPLMDAPVLTDLDVSQNKLGELDAGSLRGLPKLMRLDLHENEDLRFPNYSVFAEAPQLAELDVTDCGARRFVDARLPSLKVLLYGRNSIVEIAEPVERYLPAVERLDLSFNNLTTLSATTLNGSRTLQSVDLAGNSFHCDCALAPFVAWAEEQKRHDLVDVVGARGYHCDSPPLYYAHLVLATVSKLDCNKPPDPRPSNGTPLGALAVEVIFGCLTAVVVAVSVAVACYCRRRPPQNSSSSSLSSVAAHVRSPPRCCDWLALHLCGGRWLRARAGTMDEERDLMGPTPTATPTEPQAPPLL